MYLCVYKDYVMYIQNQAITALSHAGVCVSYTSAWKYALQLSADAHYTELIRTGHWIWVYDNVNFCRQVRHEREGSTCTYLLHMHHAT